MGAHPLLRLHDSAVQQFRQLDVAVKNAGAILISNSQRVPKAACGHQQRGLALALQQGVGGHSGAHLDAGHLLGGHGLTRLQAQQMPDTCHGRVSVLLRVLAEQLVRDQTAIGALAHHVGECAAPVDPELPAVGAIDFHEVSQSEFVSRRKGRHRLAAERAAWS